jgi:FkbM family methyltransferase
MKTYSQHGEDLIIDDLNEINQDSVILDIGANDGITFSNSRLFIEKYGCKSYLVEPTSECIRLLNTLYENTEIVKIIPYAISEKIGPMKINVGNLMDLPTCVNQVSTLLDDERVYWERGRNVKYTEEIIQSITPKKLVDMLDDTSIDLLSIDTEGMDYVTLSGLYDLGIRPKIIVFEWNNKIEVLNQCEKLLSDNYEIIFKNDVNLIFKVK